MKNWADNWEFHISKYCNLYFCDKELIFLYNEIISEYSASILGIENTSKVSVIFKIKDFEYIVDIAKGNENKFICYIFYKKFIENENENICSEAYTLDNYLLNIAGFNRSFTKVCDLFDMVEEIIISDMKSREDNDWDGGDDEEEESPYCPISPSECLFS